MFPKPLNIGNIGANIAGIFLTELITLSTAFWNLLFVCNQLTNNTITSAILANNLTNMLANLPKTPDATLDNLTTRGNTIWLKTLNTAFPTSKLNF